MLEGNDEYTMEIASGIPEYVVSSVFSNDEENINYAFVSYILQMKMTFLNQVFDKETQETMSNMMNDQGFDARFVSDSEITLSQPNAITIFLKDEITNGDWCIINYDATSPMMDQLLPVNVIKKAKIFMQERMLQLSQKK